MKNTKIKNRNGKSVRSSKDQRPVIGILEQFCAGDEEKAKETAEGLKKMGITHLQIRLARTGYAQGKGEAWLDWLIPFLSQQFDLFPCFGISVPGAAKEADEISPKDPEETPAEFADWFTGRYGKYFSYAGLCYEPLNPGAGGELFAPDVFVGLTDMACSSFRMHGKKVVLAGIHPEAAKWLTGLAEYDAFRKIDVLGLQDSPEEPVPADEWRKKVEQLRTVFSGGGLNPEFWITATGYSTDDFDERMQLEKFVSVAELPVSRVYWHSLTDMRAEGPRIRAAGGSGRYLGLMNADGTSKLLHRFWISGGIENIMQNKWLVSANERLPENSAQRVLITGGAGFIGTNLAHRLMTGGYHVTVLDNLSRPGVEHNLKWLKEQHPGLRVLIADTRDRRTVEEAVNDTGHVFHFAAQVAVTNSLVNPVHDFEVNVAGTINLLEAIRKSPSRPSLIYTSTNKVYGNLADIELTNDGISYSPKNEKIRMSGVGENRHLDFHSPYGSSKGSADQYILDYARSFGLRNAVFRMSCIYGPHQFGNEDQGWVAHFILKALKREKITLYGDGMQVRDVLYVDDLINAFLKAWEHIDLIRGEAFNMGGGPANAISLLELIKMLEEKLGAPVSFEFENWRQGDQKYYVSDSSKFSQATGWKASVPALHGIGLLYDWLKQYRMNGHLQKSTAFAEIIR
ncbi:MAG: NAD-dependent epimerase/dehydratase family protein [Mangrovibacterium sp.]